MRAGLADFGYEEGRTVASEIRSAEGHYDRLAPLATELVRAKVEAIARSQKLELQKFELRRLEQFDATFASIGKARMDAVVVQDDTLFAVNARALAEQATRFELWLNSRTASALGIQLPEAIRMRADNIIQ